LVFQPSQSAFGGLFSKSITIKLSCLGRRRSLTDTVLDDNGLKTEIEATPSGRLSTSNASICLGKTTSVNSGIFARLEAQVW
jgi:hypothetical protein